MKCIQERDIGGQVVKLIHFISALMKMLVLDQREIQILLENAMKGIEAIYVKVVTKIIAERQKIIVEVVLMKH